MINKFREFAARVAVLAADESGMSTVEYANVELYTRRVLMRQAAEGGGDAS